MSKVIAQNTPSEGLSQTAERFLTAINGRWHELAMRVFVLIVLTHWLEHVAQAVQVYLLGWPRPSALGALGLIFPVLVSSEWMHYLYALAMLVGLIVLRSAVRGSARRWWNIALGIQVWHHFEHGLLLSQALLHQNLFGSPVPVSILQLVLPRMELHLFYNALVTAPMLMAMLQHLFPSASDRRAVVCTCARSSRLSAVQS